MTDIDPALFRAFEHHGWEQSVDAYDRYFGPLTRQTIEPLLDAVNLAVQTRELARVSEGPNDDARTLAGPLLLDVASGPGYVAAAGRARGANVVAIDFSERMVTRAKALHADIAFRQGDAEVLEFPRATFDVVVMSFGILHLSRPEDALRECARVLKPRGRLGFTVWCEPAEARGFAIVQGAIEAHGEPSVKLPAGPPFFRFSRRAESTAALEAAGLTGVSIVQVPMVWELDSAGELVEAFLHGTARTGGMLRAQPPAALAAIRRAVERDSRPFAHDGGGLRIPMPALVVSATKP